MIFLNKAIFFLFSFFVLVFFSNVNANLEGNATVNSNGINVEWNSVSGVDLFRIDYGISSGNYTDKVDFLEGTSYTFSNLNQSVSYFFTVVGYNEYGEDSYISPEFSVFNSSNSNSTQLFVKEAKMISLNEIELTFSNRLVDSEDRDFIIESLSNSNDYFEVLDSKIHENDSTKLLITLDGVPRVGVNYRVLVLSILDEFGQNIQFGVDSETVFMGTDIFEEIITPVIEDEIELNSADEEPVNTTTINTTNVGVEIDSSEIDSNLLKVAEDAGRLPQTGPAELLLLLIAFFFGLFIFMHKFKKTQ